jgi:hypothetical protein
MLPGGLKIEFLALRDGTVGHLAWSSMSRLASSRTAWPNTPA